jgi:hypothetical protein
MNLVPAAPTEERQELEESVMFKSIRTTAGIAAVAAVAGVAAVGGAAPQSAEAAARCYWEIPSAFEIKQDNGWTVKTRSKAGKYKWNISAYPGARDYTSFGKMRLTRFDVSGSRPQVEFTVTLSNGSAGVYTGTINKRGFIKGTTTDEFSGAMTYFRVLEPVDCA